MITKVVKVDLHQPIYEKLTAKQGDIASRFILFHLLDGDTPLDLTEKSVRVYARKPDNTEIFNDLIINDRARGYCTLELTSQCLAEPGIVKMELYVSESDKVLTSIPFDLKVISCINTDNSVVSTNEFSALNEALGSLQDYDNLKREIIQARKTYTNVGKRLDSVDSQLEQNKSEIDSNKKEIDSKYREEEFFNSKYEVYLRKTKNNSPATTNIIIDNNTDNRSKDFPCLEILQNGDLIVIYRDGNDHASYDGVLKLSRSTNEGVDWSDPIIIFNKSNTDYRDPNVFLTQNGTLVLCYVERVENAEKTHKVRMARSTDNGNSWADLGYMPMGNATTYSSRGGLTQLPDGKIICPIYVKNGASGAYLISSDDDGLTWKFYSWITKDEIIETSVCYHPTRNEILAVIRGNELFDDVHNLKQRLYTTVSKDNGLTWERLYLLPFYAHCPIVQPYREDYVISIRNTDIGVQGKYSSDMFICDGKTVKEKPYFVNGSEHTHDLGYIDFRIKNNNIYAVWYSYTKKIVYSTIPTSRLKGEETVCKSYHTNTNNITTELSTQIFTTGKYAYQAIGNLVTDNVIINIPSKPTSIYYANLNFENMNKVMMSEIVSYDKNTGDLTFGIRRVDGANITNIEKTLYYFVVHN